MEKKPSRLLPDQQVDFFHPVCLDLTPSAGKICRTSPIKGNNLSEQTQ